MKSSRKYPYFTIIIPVFNAADYLERCVSSLIQDTSVNYEIILVDDGSTDGSQIICDQFASQFTFITVYHCENSGVSAARNFGIDHSSGEYIVFIDSDDWVSENFIEFLYSHLSDKNVDILQYGYQEIEDGNFTKKMTPYFPEKIYNKNEIEQELLPSFIGSPRIFEHSQDSIREVWSCVYRLEFLNSCCIRFHSLDEIIFEDQLFSFQAMISAHSVEISHQIMYYYTCREGSLSRRKHRNMLERIVTLLNIQKKTLNASSYWERYQSDYYNNSVNCFYQCVANSCSAYNTDRKESIYEIKKILKHPLCVESLKKCDKSNLPVSGHYVYWLMRLKLVYPIYYLYRLRIIYKYLLTNNLFHKPQNYTFEN